MQHVCKAWVENAIKKIVSVEEQSRFLSTFGNIMYFLYCLFDVEHVYGQQFELLATNYLDSPCFITYLKKH
jgi:hypothetical protein